MVAHKLHSVKLVLGDWQSFYRWSRKDDDDNNVLFTFVFNLNVVMVKQV